MSNTLSPWTAATLRADPTNRYLCGALAHGLEITQQFLLLYVVRADHRRLISSGGRMGHPQINGL